VVNFSSLYGITAPKLAAKMRSTVEVAQVSLDAYFAKYKKLQPFIDWTYDFVTKNGYMRTVDGFQRPLYNKQVRDWRTKKVGLRWDVYNQCPNTAIQGSVGGHVKIAWTNAHIELEQRISTHGVRWGWIAQEHDALVVWCDPGLEDLVDEVVIRCMETAVKLRVEMKCDKHWGDSWGEAKWAA
jgi:DNA polymerase-1